MELDTLRVRLGDRAESVIGQAFDSTGLSAPELAPEEAAEGRGMETSRWYRIPVAGGMTADGSAYHIYARKGTSDSLCILLSGGGIAWNRYTASHPVTGGRVLAWAPNYYWSNLRPFTEVFNIGVGITENAPGRNPFDDWNFVVITYATGDMHLGRSEFRYRDEDGAPQVLHFHGYGNFLQAMEIGRTLFPAPGRLLIAGESAGAFAVPALAETVCDVFYPECRDVTLFSDSAQLKYGGWHRIAEEVWNIPLRQLSDLQSDEMTVDWYRGLYARSGGKYRCLYASSVRDYLLSAFYNDLQNKEYMTGEYMQRAFQAELERMVGELKQLSPSFGIYLYDRHRPFLYKGGTIHTMLRQPEFYLRGRSGPSMAEWLRDAVDGRVRDEGLQLLQ
ncbi:MAG: pectin acetylesterase [Lachnospiraceae bacterium]|nr:pectin acetylesterase [Lachnospiraceae bacterium]